MPDMESIPEGESDSDVSKNGTDNNVDEMLEVYEDMKEKTKNLDSPWDALDKLPEGAWLDDSGKLWVHNHTDPSQNTASLTEKRRRILKSFIRTGSYKDTHEELETSNSHVHRAVNLFSFLLDDPKLYEAFVLESRAEGWQVMYDEEVACVGGEEAAEHFKKKSSKFTDGPVKVLSPEEEPEDFELERQKKSPVSALDEKLLDEEDESPGQTIKDRPNKSTQSSSETKQASQSSTEEEALVSLDSEETKRVVAALYRDGQDELANSILDRSR